MIKICAILSMLCLNVYGSDHPMWSDRVVTALRLNHVPRTPQQMGHRLIEAFVLHQSDSVIFDLILNHDIDFMVRDEMFGFTPLQWAFMSKRFSVIDTIVQYNNHSN